MVGSTLRWQENGVIALTASPANRMVFFESETIDHVFEGIEDLIGMPIEHIVVESRCRETRRYIERAFPPEVRALIDSRETNLGERLAKMSAGEKETLYATMKAITGNIFDIARAYGYGVQEMSELWEQGVDFPWRVQIMRNPYSRLFLVADNLGSVEAFEGVEMQVRYERIGEDAYRMEVYPGAHSLEMKDRFKRRRYDFKPGGAAHEPCPRCGVPLAVSRRRWDLAAGTITDEEAGRRMAIFGPFSLDSICDDLEAELGEAIPDTVIEAARRYIKATWDVENWNRDGLTFQQMIALRGLGNLVRFEGDADHLEVCIENSCLHLLMIGAAQALVELAYRVEESRVEWELCKDGDLRMVFAVER